MTAPTPDLKMLKGHPLRADLAGFIVQDGGATTRQIVNLIKRLSPIVKSRTVV
jgi:hypothetical protein